jgi:phenylpropionate dioxygenase-like ring-hydroxylating dioxygenase large terminal subunit
MLSDVLMNVREGLDEGLVPPAIFGDPELHQRELEQVFARSWVFLALEDEIRSAGDYVLRRIGEDEVVVSRDDSGEIHVLLNKCRHRGTLICRDDKGNTSHFRCPYHGWVYGNDGRWAGAPKRRRAYRELDADQWGLLEAPRIEVRWSMIFANLDAEGPSLDEDLGPMAWFLDGFLGLDSRGLKALGEPNRWVAKTNWKSGAENIGGDNYHVPTAHASCVEVGMLPDVREASESNAQFELGHGHTFTAMAPVFDPATTGPYGHPLGVWNRFDQVGLTPEHLDLLSRHYIFTATVFPNLSFFRSFGAPDPETGVAPIYTMVRLWQPLGPDRTEVWNWICAYEAEPAETYDEIYRAGMLLLGPAGFIEQDDMAVWEGAPIVAKSVMARKLGFRFNYQLGIGGMSVGGPLPNYDGPGKATDKSYNEGNQRSFVRRWLELMSEDPR